ncbi:MAG: imidazole glycerol phosphate synthase subunit HisH [Myxococcota bacterium]
MRAIVVPTGTANLASVRAALGRLGVEVALARGPADVAGAERVVLPGVGAFGAAMAELRALGVCGALAARIAAGRPTLAVCLGLQVLARGSAESPGVAGLGVLPVDVAPLAAGVRTPQLGWNEVTGLGAPGWAFFAHGYRLAGAPPGWEVGWTVHGGPVVAAVRRGAVLGCQFHPELSGRFGEGLLRDWLHAHDAKAPDAFPSNDGNASGAFPSGVARRVVACLDLDGGRVVKGVRFQGLRDAGDPVARAVAYEAQGADEVVLLDVSATPRGRGHALATVRAVRDAVGRAAGRRRRRPHRRRRALLRGRRRQGRCRRRRRRPRRWRRLAARFGAQCVTLALDAARRRRLEVVVRSGRERTGRDVVAWVRGGRLARRRRDPAHLARPRRHRPRLRPGPGAGRPRAVRVPVVASGGARTADDLARALDAGADAVLVASMLHDGHHRGRCFKDALAGQRVRPAMVGSISTCRAAAGGACRRRGPAVEAGDPRPWAERLGRAGEVAVVDLDAARGEGSNAALVHSLLGRARCRVGGGIRDAATARAWLDAGAHWVVLGTAAAVPEVLRALPPERVVAAVDARDGEVVAGWRQRTGEDVRSARRGRTGGFLVTFVEREGRLAAPRARPRAGASRPRAAAR